MASQFNSKTTTMNRNLEENCDVDDGGDVNDDDNDDDGGVCHSGQGK